MPRVGARPARPDAAGADRPRAWPDRDRGAGARALGQAPTAQLTAAGTRTPSETPAPIAPEPGNSARSASAGVFASGTVMVAAHWPEASVCTSAIVRSVTTSPR